MDKLINTAKNVTLGLRLAGAAALTYFVIKGDK